MGSASANNIGLYFTYRQVKMTQYTAPQGDFLFNCISFAQVFRNQYLYSGVAICWVWSSRVKTIL